MKIPVVFGLACLALAPSMASMARAADRQACSADVDITDTDPKGTNVRAAPGGAAIALLKNPGEGWIGVHLTGQLGDWFEIDRATLIDPDLPAGEKLLFQGRGYLHKSVVGLSGMENDGAIYTDHDSQSPPVDLHAPGDQQVDLLGCWGEFLKVHVRKGTGWTKEACTNMNTTCT